MSFVGGMGMATGPASGLRFAQTRGRIGGGGQMQGVNYPSPFFDVAHTYLPVTVKALFKWCRYYFLTNPLINATVFKLSEYPVTDIIIDHEDNEVKRRWTDYFNDHLRYNAFRVEVGLDKNAYGNACISMGFPFKKYLHCRACNFRDEAAKIRSNWIFTNFQFRLSCPKCQFVGDAFAKDVYYKNASGIKAIRWNPEDIEISYNDISGEYTYFYTIPAVVRNDVVIGRKDIVEGVPQVFIQAMRESKGVIFSKENFFHMRRPTLATQDRGWGIPLLLPVLKDTFYLQVMKKAQEAILLEHIVPLRILFPQAGSGSSDPYCISPSTLVETFDGVRPASEIKPGDYLRSHTGTWRRVLYEKRRAVRTGEKVFQFTVATMPAFPFTVSEEHPILAVPSTETRHGRSRQRWVAPAFIEAQKLKEGDYVAYPVDALETKTTALDLAGYLPERTSTEKYVYLKMSPGAAAAYEYEEARGWEPYKAGPGGARQAVLDAHGWSKEDWCTAFSMKDLGVARIPRHISVSEELSTLVGYYLAEGSVGTGGIVGFAFHENEHECHADVERCVRALGFPKGVHLYPNSVGKGVDIRLGTVLLSELLVGLCGEGFGRKTIPHEIVDAGRDRVISMLRALFEGDGWDSRDGTNVVGLALSNPHMIVEARRLLLSFGLIGVVSKEEPNDYELRRTTSYKLAYNGAQADRLRALFGWDPGALEAGRPPGVFRDGYVLVPVRAIEVVADVPEVIGFQMDGDQSFCVPSCAHHNTTINLVDWRDQIAAEIGRWRMDNNYIPILPLPVGNQTIGGDGRALMLTQEIAQWSDQILNGMGVPTEFIRGGMSYAGTNVSMRMMENMFLGDIQRHRQLARFVMKQVSSYLGWPEATIRFKPFKMADDLQRKAYLFQLNAANKVSDTTLLADSDLSQDDENTIMIRETDMRVAATKKQQLAMAQIQGEAQMVMMKFQAKAQEAMMVAQGAPNAPGEPGGAEQPLGVPDAAAAAAAPQGAAAPQQGQQAAQGGMMSIAAGGPPSPQDFLSTTSSQLTGKNKLQGAGIDLPSLAMAQARTIALLPDKQKGLALQNLELQSPELANLVKQMLASLQGEQQGGGGKSTTNAVDMRPQPEQRPARRANPGV